MVSWQMHKKQQKKTKSEIDQSTGDAFWCRGLAPEVAHPGELTSVMLCVCVCVCVYMQWTVREHCKH